MTKRQGSLQLMGMRSVWYITEMVIVKSIIKMNSRGKSDKFQSVAELLKFQMLRFNW